VNEQLKKRLIGAAVLVLLAVIFVPMLFNSGEQTEMPTFGSNVPPKPDAPFQTIEVPLQTPPAPVVENQPINSTREATALEAQAAAPVATPPPAAPAPAQSPAATPAPAPTPAPAAAQPTPRATAPVAPAPTRSSATRPESGWAVQLGSFSSSANALSLRDKLRKKGFAAYVEHQKSSGYRVRVGPELKRDNADALKVKLEKAGFKGVVMPHP
jgi:DedD protein